jgi:hypothetical protein
MSEILLKKYIGLHVKYLLFFSEFNWTWIFWTFFFFFLYTYITFPENLFSGSRGQTDGQTDGRDKANSRLWQFCERVQKIASLGTSLFIQMKWRLNAQYRT